MRKKKYKKNSKNTLGMGELHMDWVWMNLEIKYFFSSNPLLECYRPAWGFDMTEIIWVGDQITNQTLQAAQSVSGCHKKSEKLAPREEKYSAACPLKILFPFHYFRTDVECHPPDCCTDQEAVLQEFIISMTFCGSGVRKKKKYWKDRTNMRA